MASSARPANSSRPATVILNPAAGRGKAGTLRVRIQALLEDAGFAPCMVESRAPGHATDLAAALGPEPGLVIVAGGDGTVSEVVNGLAQAARPDAVLGPIGLLPMGSGNDFGATLGYRSSLEHDIRKMARGQVRRLDLGYVRLQSPAGESRRYFDNSMGVGLEACVTMESYRIRRLQGVLLYAWAAIRTLHSYRPPQMDVCCDLADGSRWRRNGATLMVTVGNGPRSGGGFRLTPDAEPDDGLLDAGVAAGISRWATLGLLPLAIFGKHTGHPAVTMVRGTAFCIDCPGGTPVQLDGEILAADARRVEITVEPGRLAVLV